MNIRAILSKVSSILLIIGIILGLISAPANDSSARASRLDPRLLTEVFHVARHRETDLLIFWDGSRQTGILLNKTFSLRTAYAPLKFEKKMLAGLKLDNGYGGGESLITVNSNRFSGFLEDPFFTFQPETGDRLKVRREKVWKVLFRVREEELQGWPQGRWFRLKNGDWFSGQLLSDPLPISTAHGPVSVSLKETARLVFSTNRPSLATITRRHGEPLQGRLALEDVRILLDLGRTVNLYPDYIGTICDPLAPGAVFPAATTPPVTVEAPVTIAAITTNQPPARPSVPETILSNANSTNREGLVWIPAGEFTMGSSLDEEGRDRDEGPPTKVTLSHGFWMGKYEVTQADYQALMGTNPSDARGDPSRPVEKVSWYEALEYCAQLTRRAQAAGQLPKEYAYRLPTEAEWEYACRAGTTTRFSHGEDKGYLRLGDYAWFTRNGASTTHAVGTKKPNAWGLYDMHGNVWEWCLDRWADLLPGGQVTNFVASTEGPLRVARGGSWLYEGKACRSANRDDYGPSNRCSDIGFRIVLAPLLP